MKTKIIPNKASSFNSYIIMRKIFETQNWEAKLMEKSLKLKETWPWIHWRKWLKCKGILNRGEKSSVGRLKRIKIRKQSTREIDP